MMSPQANFAYSYGYSFSPRRQGSSQRKRMNKEPSLPEECIQGNVSAVEGRKQSSTPIQKTKAVPRKGRGSPAAVVGTTRESRESESLGDVR
jgi:hypothetical protein